MVIKIRKRIKLQSLLMWIGLVCVVSYALLEHVSVPIPAFSAAKMPFLYIGGICVFFQLNILLNNILKKRYFYVFLVLFFMCILLLISMYQNSGVFPGFSPQRTTVRLILFLLELFILAMIFAEEGKSSAAIKFVFYYVLVLVGLTDVLMFSGLIHFGTEKNEMYLIGTKFTVVYMHLNLLALWLVQRWKKDEVKPVKKWEIWVAAFILVFVSVYVNCMSGVLGSCFLAILLVWTNSLRGLPKLLSSPTFIILCTLACTLVAFVFGFVLNIPFIESFVEEVLGRSTTLTGRVDIYLGYADVMRKNWLLGYGYGSGSLVSYRFFGCANAQNAVLHWILQSGIVTTTLLIALMAIIMKSVNKHRKKDLLSIAPVLALIYTYVMLGTVEITYSMSFILWLALIFMVSNDKRRNVVVSNERNLV